MAPVDRHAETDLGRMSHLGDEPPSKSGPITTPALDVNVKPVTSKNPLLKGDMASRRMNNSHTNI